jgi:hypothetical protein
VGSLKDAFAQFDLNEDDIIDTREQVSMYNELKGSMQTVLDEFSSHGMYDQAIDLRDRMVSLRKQFEQMQKKAEIDRQENEEKQLREAGNIIRKTRLKEWGQRQINLQHHLKAQHDDLVEVHRVQTHQLEEEMSIIPKPIIKFSTNMLAMKNSEKELVKQLRFEEAKSLRKRIDVLEAREVGSYEKRLEAADEMRRQRLQDSQAVDDKKRLQMSKKFEWSQARHKERDMMLTVARVANNRKDMLHCHHMDKMKQPQFTTRPIVPNRASHDQTSSTMRGTQLLKTVATGRKAVAELCGQHDFGDY